MDDYNNFTVSVRWVQIEGLWVFEATTPQFPDVAEYADSRMEALSLMGDTIDTFVEMDAGKNR